LKGWPNGNPRSRLGTSHSPTDLKLTFRGKKGLDVMRSKTEPWRSAAPGENGRTGASKPILSALGTCCHPSDDGRHHGFPLPFSKLRFAFARAGSIPTPRSWRRCHHFDETAVYGVRAFQSQVGIGIARLPTRHGYSGIEDTLRSIRLDKRRWSPSPCCLEPGQTVWEIAA
jgi:hypothetical protein